ncbi:MAG: response regulator transcription factor [Saprospiraceae bacterium]|nr:response regulator transcription factor [Saprospiraceae bacterium]
MNTPIKVLLYEDNRDLREGISFLLQATAGLDLRAALPHVNNIRTDLAAHQPDVVLMDINMPGMTGLEALPIVKEINPNIQVVLLTVFDDDERIFQALRSGASGYLLKNTPPGEIVQAVFDVHKGGSPMTSTVARKVLQFFQQPVKPIVADHDLSARELDILRGLMKGYSYKLIADELGISLDTVRSHIRNVYDKLQVNSKTEAILKAMKEGWVG